jgi:hypothetical protein
MNHKKIINYYCLDILLSINFDLLLKNIELDTFIHQKNKKYKKYNKIINYIIENNICKNYIIDEIFNFHETSKCIILKNNKIKDEILLISVTKPGNTHLESFFLNKNRLKFIPNNLSWINKDKCEIFQGIYNELFEYNFFENMKIYIEKLSENITINLVGKSINGMVNIIFSYLINMIVNNKINIYSYSICKFCNQTFIDELEKKNNIHINIINHQYDIIQLLVNIYTLNFKNIILINNNIFIQNNKNKNQDDIIKNNFKENIFSYSIKYHYSNNFFNSLLKCLEH